MDSRGFPATKVGVIGAGPCGLITARELRREGLQVVVFEKSDQLGGMWVYDERGETNSLLSQGEAEGVELQVHSSIYRSLRTNVPRQLMRFLDFPFKKEGHSGDPRTYPGHEEVLAYVNDFAKEFQLVELIRFCSEVVRVHRKHGSPHEWIVQYRSSRARRDTSNSKPNSEELLIEVFDAIVVCVGHNTVPNYAQIRGIDKWTGEQIHSHSYRIPEPFRDKIVVLIGSGPSARDISRDISQVAKEVHLASRSPSVKIGKLDNYNNMWQHSMIEFVSEDGKVAFQDGSSVFADIIFHCTGYKFNYPFLETNGIVTVEDNRVGPLYKHIFPPHLAPWLLGSLAPWLSFVGIPAKVIPFMTYEMQAKWVSQVLSGKVLLPSEQEMINSVEEYYRNMEEKGRPKHYTHKLDEDKFEHINWIAAQLGLPPLEDWMEQMAILSLKHVYSGHDGYRDTFDGDDWIQQFHSSQKKKRFCWSSVKILNACCSKD